MDPQFQGFSVRQLGTPLLGDLGTFKVIASANFPLPPNEPLRAWVGEQELQAVGIDQFGLSISGFVEAMPSDTDTLSFQLYGADKTDTGLTVQSQPPNS